MRFGGFADDENRHPTRWANVQMQLGPLLFRWKSGDVESNLVDALADDQIEAFVTVAELRSFGAAGERLGLTPQAVSQLIAELESVLGFRLFDRTTRRVELSSAGRDYLGSAGSVFRQAQAADAVAADVRNRAAGVVRVGAPLALTGTRFRGLGEGGSGGSNSPCLSSRRCASSTATRIGGTARRWAEILLISPITTSIGRPSARRCSEARPRNSMPSGSSRENPNLS